MPVALLSARMAGAMQVEMVEKHGVAGFEAWRNSRCVPRNFVDQPLPHYPVHLRALGARFQDSVKLLGKHVHPWCIRTLAALGKRNPKVGGSNPCSHELAVLVPPGSVARGIRRPGRRLSEVRSEK